MLFLLLVLRQRESIAPCEWSSPYLPRHMLLWQSERSSSWTPALRSKHSSTPRGSTETQTPSCHNLDCCGRLRSTCTLWLLTVLRVFKCITVPEREWLGSLWSQRQFLWSTKSNDLSLLKMFLFYVSVLFFFFFFAVKFFCAAVSQHYSCRPIRLSHTLIPAAGCPAWSQILFFIFEESIYSKKSLIFFLFFY